MSLFEIIGLALSLALDAFAVSLAVGTARLATTPRSVFRLSFHFGLFQFFMPVIGWAAGYHIARYISFWDHWLVMGLLAIVGIRMILSGCTPDQRSYLTDPSRGWTLVFLSVATSLDALAIGLSLAMLGVSIWYPSAIIGLVTAVLSLIGLLAGHRLGARFGKRMEVIGGLLLLVIGGRVLIAHLTASKSWWPQ